MVIAQKTTGIISWEREKLLNNREVGAEAEALAARYLTGQGMHIVEHNFRSRQGEIDIIGWHEGYLVFVEVKFRSNDQKGTPQEAVNRVKQRRICRTADYYRLCRRVTVSTPVRYDVLAISGDSCQWFRNAFPHIYVQ